MEVKKSLKKVFVEFLLKTILGLVAAVSISILLFCFFVMIGEVNLANISEKEAYAAVEEMKKTGQTDKVLEQLSSRIKYIRLDTNNEIISASMSEQEAADALAYLQEQPAFDNGVKRYLSLEQGEENIVLYYRVETYFTNADIDKILPSPEIVFIVIALLGIVINVILQVNRLEQEFRNELQPILKATEEIGKQNLNYKIEPVKIKEFDEIQNALTDMKNELTKSFQKQWAMQQNQKEQIAALAHDLKTPMTVAMGSLDLLSETRMKQEQRKFIESAIESLEEMERYIHTLINMTISNVKNKKGYQKFSLTQLERKIIKQTKILCREKNIQFWVEHRTKRKLCIGDEKMMERAIMNLIRNAIEYVPVEGKIMLRVLPQNHYLCFQVCDNGSGFSEKMLRQGTKLFSMDDNSRTGKNKHYGIGLYFADIVAKLHGGGLRLGNLEPTGGAVVELLVK